MNKIKFALGLLKFFMITLTITFSFIIGYSFSPDYSNNSFQIPLSGAFQTDISSPSDHISNQDVLFYNDKIVLNIEEATYSYFADTKSMDPLIDSNTIGIEVKPSSEDEIEIGDIIAYESEKGITIIHRVIKINEDSEGNYYITKGDNNLFADNEKIRFDQIEGILVGVLY